MDDHVFRLLEQADWREMSKDLLNFAVFWSRKYPTLGYGEDPRFLAAGVSYEDVVQEVITKAFCGERKWDPGEVALLPWLKMQIKSIIDNLARSKAATVEISLPAGRKASADGTYLELDPQHFRHRAYNPVGADPEQIITSADGINEAMSLLHEAAAGDDELEAVIAAVESGIDPAPRHLAACLGVPVSAVYRQLRRLRGRVERLKMGEEHEQEKTG